MLPLLACLYLPFIGGGLRTDDYAHLARISTLASISESIIRPDTFGFYRPTAQVSLALESSSPGWQPWRSRLVNILLHGVVIALALAVARLALVDTFAAGLAVLAFALTPNAHPAAVLWISARPELLMSVFSLTAVAAWIVWTRRGSGGWLALAGGAYALAFVSKETAALLPLLLLAAPRADRSWKARVTAVAALCVLGVAIASWRAHLGALTPFSPDPHYNMLTGPARWLRSVQNYSGRMLAAPIALVLVAFVASVISERRSGRPRIPSAGFAAAWVLIFLAPVLPIVARSELYLYLPVFGICLVAGILSAPLLRVSSRTVTIAALTLYVALLGAYQVSRADRIAEANRFSEQFVTALANQPELVTGDGTLVIVPADPDTERLLRDSIGGYLPVVLAHALGHPRLTGEIQYDDVPVSGKFRFICHYRNGEVGLTAVWN